MRAWFFVLAQKRRATARRVKGLADLGGAEVAGVALAVKEDEVAEAAGEAPAGPGPAQVGQGGLAELVEQARRLGRVARGGAGVVMEGS